MNRKQKRKLKRRAKMIVICGAVFCLTTGAVLLGSKVYTCEVKTENLCAAHDPFPATSITVDETKSSEPMIQVVPTSEFDESDSITKPYDLDADDAYLLARIAMAEAEGEDTEGKALVIMTVLNRVHSSSFPDTIEKVIYQKGQFSPVSNGRFDMVEPDEDCYAALRMVQEDGLDESDGALYFESESTSRWHHDNLKYLFKHGNHYFYTER